MAQMKYHKEKKIKKEKAKLCLFAGVSEIVFTRFMTHKIPKTIWDYLKEDMQGMRQFEACKC